MDNEVVVEMVVVWSRWTKWKGSDNFNSTQRPTGSATAACISNSGSDYFRDNLGLSDCIDYWTYYNGKVHFRDHRGLEFNGQGSAHINTIV